MYFVINSTLRVSSTEKRLPGEAAPEVFAWPADRLRELCFPTNGLLPQLEWRDPELGTFPFHGPAAKAAAIERQSSAQPKRRKAG